MEFRVVACVVQLRYACADGFLECWGVHPKRRSCCDGVYVSYAFVEIVAPRFLRTARGQRLALGFPAFARLLLWLGLAGRIFLSPGLWGAGEGRVEARKHFCIVEFNLNLSGLAVVDVL